MRRFALGIALFLLTTHIVPFGQEIAVPNNPVPATITSYKIVSFSMEREPDWRFVITYKDSNDKTYNDTHFGLTNMIGPNGPTIRPEGADELMKAFNTGNFTTNSIIKRLFQHLVQHGKIPPSSVQGTPEGD